MSNLNEILVSIPRPANVTRTMLLGMICGWLESTPNEWVLRAYSPILPEGIEYKDFQNGGKFTSSQDYWSPKYLMMLHPGCTIPILVENVEDDDRGDSYVFNVNLESCIKGMQVLAEKHPDVFNDIIEGNDDANTAAAWAECMVYGDIIFS